MFQEKDNCRGSLGLHLHPASQALTLQLYKSISAMVFPAQLRSKSPYIFYIHIYIYTRCILLLKMTTALSAAMSNPTYICLCNDKSTYVQSICFLSTAVALTKVFTRERDRKKNAISVKEIVNH
ncbi:hypothetical protein OIU84_015087 [Salix udensis]|uniref:Uncharacterized protein n=1 Tax=Salix udensis TaxID=889485 RepID=A0AAD6JDD5_9ROSI|nr:hypothetical protein OIU84_015087 [Salix udensis]KAJ6403096.1 hypothetical protein OIU84_015087 [Salix udensis]